MIYKFNGYIPVVDQSSFVHPMASVTGNVIVGKNVYIGPGAAISAGIFKDEALLDLCYEEDAKADVDCNIVLTEGGDFVEIQGSGEEATFTQAQMDAMLVLGRKGVTELCALQQQIIDAAMKPAQPKDLQKLADFFGKK